jgi:two-component system NtrC family sensor kinase
MLKKLAYKLILAVGVTSVVIIGVYSYFNIVSQSKVLLSEVERHAIQQSETVKNSTRYGMLLNQRDNIHEIINTVGAQPSIRDVRILNKDGEIIYSSNKDDIGKMVDKNAESCYVCHAEDKPIQRLSSEDRTRIFRTDNDSSRVLGVINPIYTEQSCWNADCHAHSKEQTVLGVLDVTMSLAEVDEQIRNSEIKVVAFAIVAIIAVSVIIGVFVKKWVDTPVNELTKATKQVAEGNLNYSIENISRDELGELQKSFNVMIKKLAEARIQLFQSDKMASLGRLAAGVAHEINNPLTGILTYSSFLLKRNEHDRELHDDLGVIVREAKRSREIVKSLLNFARQSIPRKEAADINQVIRQALKVVENQLIIHKIDVIQNLDENIPRVVIDTNQMQQVFINLFVNAADSMESKEGKITITSTSISLSPFGTAQI